MFKKYWKSVAVAFGVLVLIWSGFGIKGYMISRQKIEVTNICQDDQLIARLITKNVNPLSKFKFIKKRNVDCRILLAMNKPEAETLKTPSFCSILDASTNSVTMLVNTYVEDLYDRPSASRELKTMAKLMYPYSYCTQYYDDMMILVKLKKKLAL